MQPPAVYLSDYANINNTTDRIKLQLLMTDLTVLNREVRLKLYIEGNGIEVQSNDFVIGAMPLFLEGGIPLQLGNIDLAPYFEKQNLKGISAGAYANSLPDGLYQFCFEVYDVLSGNVISRKSCTNVLVFLNDPPFLNLPENQFNIDAINPQNILFQWTPRHINVSNVEYEFSLVEIHDNVMSPEAIFMSSPPIYQTTVQTTTLLYGLAEPQLLEGTRYAWRIKAKAKDGVDEIGMFKNNGYSEIFSFTYQGNCEVPRYLIVEEVTTQNATFKWQGGFDHTQYKIAYRKAIDDDGNSGQQNSFTWFESTIYNEEFTVIDLEPNALYEWRVGGFCVNGSLSFSDSKSFTTMDAEAEAYYNCGIEPNINITNTTPKELLQQGEVIKAGDFNVKITEVSGSGSFSGKGYTTVGFLKNLKIALTFSNIKVNTDNQFISGEIQTVYDPTWSNMLDIDEVIDEVEDVVDVFTGDDDTTITLDFDIDKDDINVDPDTGKIIITDPDDISHTYDYDNDGTFTITDASGDEFIVDKDGEVTQTGEGASGGPATAQNTNGVSNGHKNNVEDPAVTTVTDQNNAFTFRKGTGTKYELDQVDNDYERANYPKVTVTGGTDYYPVHKAVAEKDTDIFYVDIKNNNPDINIDSLIFKKVSGTAIKAEKDGQNSYKITVQGNNSYRTEEAIITYTTKDGKQQVLSSFFIHHIKKHPAINVNVVYVNGAQPLDNLHTQLNNIYSPAGATFKVGTSEEIEIDEAIWDIHEDNGIIDYSDDLSNTQSRKELNAIRNYYKTQHPSYDRKAYYIFVLGPKMKTTKEISGFMLKTNQFGYLFEAHYGGTNNKETPEAIAAHELGHGVFALAHPFEKDPSIQGTASSWLMDYGKGIELAYPNWAEMSSDALKFYFFPDNEGSEIDVTSKELIERLFNDIYCAKFKFQNTAKVYTKHKLTRNKNLQGDRNKKVWGVRILEVTFFHVITDLININLDFEERVLDASDGKNYKMIRFYDVGNKDFYIDVIPHQEDYSILVENLKNKSSQFIIDEHNNQINHYNKIRKNGEEAVKQFLYSLSPCVLDNIPVKTRIAIIESISEEWILDSNVEELVVRLLEGTHTKDDVNYFVNNTQNSKMWNELFNDINSSENAELFAGQLVRIAKIYYQNNSIEDKIIGAADIKTHKVKLLSDYQFIKGTSNVTIFEKARKYYCAGIGAGWLYDCGMEETILFENRSIWDLVTVKFEENNSYANIDADQEIKLIPIGLLVYFTEKQMTGASKQRFLSTLDIALFAVGLGEINYAVKGVRAGGYTFSSLLRLSLGIADLSAMGMDIACNSSNQSELCNEWKEINLYVNLGLISVSGLNQLSDVITKTRQLDKTGEFTKIIDNVAGTGDNISKYLKKLIGNSSSVNISWKNIDNTNIIWANPNSNILSTARTFANETGSSLYDMVLSNNLYIKFDLNDGRILLGNTSGDYHAFAVLNGIDLGAFKSSVLNVSDDLFKAKLSQLLLNNANKLKILSGVVTKQLNIAGKLITLNSNKVNTILGRYDPELERVFSELGSFKNVGLGETKGGINLLNRPDFYYDKINWWNSYNKRWLEKAIERGDDIFVATEIRIDKLFNATENEITTFGKEMKLLMDKRYKPINLSVKEWENAQEIINQVFK